MDVTDEDEKKPKRFPPAKKGAKRAPLPAPRFSFEEHLAASRQPAIDAANDAAAKYLGKVPCKICGLSVLTGLPFYPTLLYRKSGEVYDVQAHCMKGPPKWRVAVVLAWFDAVCKPCIPKWMFAHFKAARAAKAERVKKLQAAHAKAKTYPVTDKRAHKIAKHYLYAALRAVSPERKRQMYIEHYKWDARARKS